MKFNHWELLSITLPRPLSRLAVFPLEQRKIAILGGTNSFKVHLMKIDNQLERGETAVLGQGHTYVLETCRKPLEAVTETAHSCVLNKRTNKLYVLSLKKLDGGEVTPGVVKYPVEHFDVKNNVGRL